jgi:hypothetical protein
LVTSSSDSSTDINYKKVARFISSYRKNEDFSSLFDLGLVNNIVTKNDGVDNVFNINMTLKNGLDKIMKQIEAKKIENAEKKKEEYKSRKEAFIKKKEALLQEKNNNSETEPDSLVQ